MQGNKTSTDGGNQAKQEAETAFARLLILK